MTLNSKSSLLAVLVATACILCVSTVQAQNRQLADPVAVLEAMDAEIDAVIAHLALEGDVADQVRKVLGERNEKIVKARQKMRDTRGNREGMRKSRGLTGALNEEAKEALAEILTEEQLAAYSEFMAQRRTQRFRDPRR